MRDSVTPRGELPDILPFLDEVERVLNLRTMIPSATNIVIVESELSQFFADIDFRLELTNTTQRRIDRKLATGFNVFRLIEPNENKFSDIIAELLDPKGSHGQDGMFLRLLFEKLNFRPAKDFGDIATVQREAPTRRIDKYRRRIDILVEARALVAIENKVDSVEQADQVKDYLEHLRQSARRQSVQATLIYLTPNGRNPKSLPPAAVKELRQEGTLHCWSYQKELREWLEKCRQSCDAERIRNFLSDFIAYIESALRREFESDKETSNEL